MPGWVREGSLLEEDSEIRIELGRIDFPQFAEGKELDGELELEEGDVDVLESITECHGLSPLRTEPSAALERSAARPESQAVGRTTVPEAMAVVWALLWELVHGVRRDEAEAMPAPGTAGPESNRAGPKSREMCGGSANATVRQYVPLSINLE